jgi:hypothetical protein
MTAHAHDAPPDALTAVQRLEATRLTPAMAELLRAAGRNREQGVVSRDVHSGASGIRDARKGWGRLDHIDADGRGPRCFGVDRLAFPFDSLAASRPSARNPGVRRCSTGIHSAPVCRGPLPIG